MISTPSLFTLRPARPEDEPFLYELYCSTRAEELAAWGWSTDQLDAFLRMQFTAQQHHYRVRMPDTEHRLILLEGLPVGRLLVNRSPEEIRLVDISLLPARRGMGIGTALLQALQEEAAGSERPLRLQVLRANRAAHLYQRLGFAVVADNGIYLEMEWRR